MKLGAVQFIDPSDPLRSNSSERCHPAGTSLSDQAFLVDPLTLSLTEGLVDHIRSDLNSLDHPRLGPVRCDELAVDRLIDLAPSDIPIQDIFQPAHSWLGVDSLAESPTRLIRKGYWQAFASSTASSPSRTVLSKGGSSKPSPE